MKPLYLRISADLKTKLVVAAKVKTTSVNREVEHLLQDRLGAGLTSFRITTLELKLKLVENYLQAHENRAICSGYTLAAASMRKECGANDFQVAAENEPQFSFNEYRLHD